MAKKQQTYYGFSYEYGIFAMKPTTKEHIIEAFGEDSLLLNSDAEIADDCYTAIVNGKVFAINEINALVRDLKKCGFEVLGV